MTTKWKHQDKLGWQALCDIDDHEDSLKSASEHMEHSQYICFVIESLDCKVRELRNVLCIVVFVAVTILLLSLLVVSLTFKG